MSWVRNKYHAKPAVVDGIRFASMAEADRYSTLKMLERSGMIYQLVLQPRYPLAVNGSKVCDYVGDFEYTLRSGERVLEDVKGMITPVYRLKRKLFRALYGFNIVEVKGKVSARRRK